MAACIEADRIEHEIILAAGCRNRLDERDTCSGKLDLMKLSSITTSIIEQAERRAIMQSAGVGHAIHRFAIKSTPHTYVPARAARPGRIAVQDLAAAMQQPAGFREARTAEDFERAWNSPTPAT